MNKFDAILYIIANRLCKMMGVNMLFSSLKGIKCLNQPLSSDLFDSFEVIVNKTIRPNELFIAFDGLKDEYTLLNTQIDKSPHADLMKAFVNNDNISNTTYIKRSKKGTLDLRYNQIIDERKMKNNFDQKMKVVSNNSYDPVKVSIIGNTTYIIDGKHTAALCSVKNQSVRCVVVNNPFLDSFYFNVFLKIKKKRRGFKKGIEFLEKVYNV